MSNMKPVCQTSSIFEVDNVKKETILRDFFQKCKVESKANVFHVLQFFQCIYAKCCACPKKRSRVIGRTAPVTQESHLSKPADLMLQNATHLRKSAPGPPTISDQHVSCTAPAKWICADPLQMSGACHRLWSCYKTFAFCLLLTRCTIPCTGHTKRHLNVQNWWEHVLP